MYHGFIEAQEQQNKYPEFKLFALRECLATNTQYKYLWNGWQRELIDGKYQPWEFVLYTQGFKALRPEFFENIGEIKVHDIDILSICLRESKFDGIKYFEQQPALRDEIVSYCFKQYFGFKKEFKEHQQRELLSLLTNTYGEINNAPEEYKQKYLTTEVVGYEKDFEDSDESMNL